MTLDTYQQSLPTCKDQPLENAIDSDRQRAIECHHRLSLHVFFIKEVGRASTPVIFLWLNAFANFCPSIQGAPIHSNGLVVPLPSDKLVPSTRHVPVYNIFMSILVVFGVGVTQNNWVSS